MKRVFYQKEITPGFFKFLFEGREWVRIDKLRKFWEYQNFSWHDDSLYSGTFEVVKGIVRPHYWGEGFLPEAVLIALNRLYDEVDYEKEID